MVGLGAGIDGRNRDAVGMMALHDALRNVCFDFDWTYSVFWTIRPRPRCRGGTACKLGDDNGSLMLMWEDGFCRPRTPDCFEEIDGDDAVRKAFSKMSIQLYNYGEGLMGKVASDKCHKWVFKEPSECQLNISNYWQSSVDALPPEWTDQFASGIQTIAVIQAGHGLLQLGSCSIIPEDLHFVLRMRHMFESLVSQSGFFLSQFFSSKRSIPQSPSPPPPKQTPVRPPQPLLNWSGGQFPAALPNIQHSARVDFSATIKNDTHLFLHPNSDPNTSHVDEMVPAKHGGDLKWPNDVSFFDGVAGRPDEAKVPFGGDVLGSKLVTAGKRECSAGRGEGEDGGVDGEAEGYLSLQKQSNKGWKVG